MGSTKVLALTRYGRLGASSRVRVLQYLPALRARGCQVTLAPLLSDRYILDLYAGRGPWWPDIARAYWRRVAAFRDVRAFDTVWLEKEAWPWLPFICEQVLRGRTRRLVVDYDDAVWLRYATHECGAVRRLLGRKVERVMAMADVVTAGNNWLCDHASASGARQTVLLPTVVDLERYTFRTEPARRDPFTIGWIGSPSTVKYLRGISGMLERLAGRRSIRVLCVGIDGFSIPGVQVQCRPWTEGTEVAEIQAFDAGVMPLTDGDWERGKCGYKLLQYMACGVPAIGSAVGANLEILHHGENGFLASVEADWIDALERLMDDAALYQRVALAGRKRVESGYSLQSQVSRLAATLDPDGAQVA